MATTEREHLEDMRRSTLESVSAHLSLTHAEEWVKLVGKAHGQYSHYRSLYSSDVPNCLTCRAYAASIQVVDALIDELGEDNKEQES